MTISKRDQLILLVIGIFFAAVGIFSQRPSRNLVAGQNDYDLNDTQGLFHGQKVASSAVNDLPNTQVLGVNNELKRIEVDLAAQRLYAFEGDHKVYDFLISSGKWGRTPTGTFHIWSKFRYTKMSGGSQALNTYYYLPNVPYVMFFSNDEVAGSRGFSLHGTYWHNNFGHPMSHGCINMKTEEAGIIYNWTSPAADGKKPARANADNPGTEIVIYGEPPEE
jgi:lipoprotein-anchoring transpeptidase ErfK/SrfK